MYYVYRWNEANKTRKSVNFHGQILIVCEIINKIVANLNLD